MPYDHRTIEPRWQRHWDEHQTFTAVRHPGRPKKYVLDIFPYPSGTGLHVGHPEGYTATDIVTRHARMRGIDVLHLASQIGEGQGDRRRLMRRSSVNSPLCGDYAHTAPRFIRAKPWPAGAGIERPQEPVRVMAPAGGITRRGF